MSSAKKKALGDVLGGLVADVTKDWAKQRKAEERHASARANRYERIVRRRHVSLKEAAARVMEKAYMLASNNGALPAAARQIMYQARPLIQDITGKQLDSKYFTQTLLPDYLAEYQPSWDVVFDDRGHFVEPHTELSFGLGTISVRDYLSGLGEPSLRNAAFSSAKVATYGPAGNYGAVLFVEKEGFMPLFEAVNLAQRFDIAIMSTKGVSVTAARTLIETLSRDIPIFCLHDFDKAGFSIVSTLSRDTRRYSFDHKPHVIDLGLRLSDVRDLDLEDSAEDAFDNGSEGARRFNLFENGATDEEAEFLLDQRVELNALTSDELVEFIERKFAEHGLKKVIPDAKLLADTYTLFANDTRIKKIVDEAISKSKAEQVPIPDDLVARVTAYIEEHPEDRWDQAVAAIVNEDRKP